jgi:tetratricopeptide (TPR) repeat protein
MKHFFAGETFFIQFFCLVLYPILGVKFMKMHILRYFSLVMIFLLVSCSKDASLRQLEQIKAIGDNDPKKALSMLDSLEIEVRGEGDYVKSKYDLLRIRLNDKAYIMPTSDIMIKKLVRYFEEKGSDVEKQEAYHYAGSVYRDLQDTPRALEHFFKALDYANANPEECDSVMLSNTYSNINDLQYKVQNYNESLKAAFKELEIDRKTKRDLTISFSHVGTSQIALGHNQEAEAAFDSVYACIVRSKTEDENQDMLMLLLDNYTMLRKMSKASECIKLIKENPLDGEPTYDCLAFAEYYRTLGKVDSAAVYAKRILEKGKGLADRYEAAKLMFRMYNAAGDVAKAGEYAAIYMQLSSAMDFGKRQEQAATVNNAYQYHLDQKREQDLKEEKERYKSISVIVFLGAALLISVGYILNVKRKQRHLKELAALSSELQRVSDDDKKLREDIKRKEKDLAESKASLKRSSSELDDVRKKLQRVNQELLENNDVLKKTEEQLEEKKEQNKTFIKLLHQSEFEEKAEDIVRAVRAASKGKKEMTLAEWKQLYKAVDELYPTFHETILKQHRRVSDKEMQVLYLIRIGLSKQQIINLTDIARVTIWRWEKKFEWVLTSES